MCTRAFPDDMRWLVAQLKAQPIALPVTDLRELTVVENLTPLPTAGPMVRGVVNRRGQVIPVIDLRRRLGMPAVADEVGAFCNLMSEREQDHLRWVAELEASVRQRRPFTLGTDPHKCAFGRWYDTYVPDNPWVGLVLRGFAEPHQRVHGMAQEVEGLKTAGRFDEALRHIERSRESGLDLMLKLFAELKRMVLDASREILAVLSIDGVTAGATLDAALAVERLTDLATLPGSSESCDALVVRSARRAGSDQPVMLLETDRLLPPQPRRAA